MPKQLPDDWLSGERLTLNVREDLGLKGQGVPSDLRVFLKPAKSKSLYGAYLPAEEDDLRPHQGRTRSGFGKRKFVEASMGTTDPFQAGKAAIEWVKEHQRSARAHREQVEAEHHHTLEIYWERWYARESSKRKTQRNFARWSRDTRLKWDGVSYGIKHQLWAQKAVEKITAADFDDYWAVLDARRTATSDMGGTKAQQKTLIRELLKEARSDFPHLSIPDFPSISRQVKQVQHLKKDEWNRLMSKIVDLSGGAARSDLNVQQYKALEWKASNRLNQRNWVDLYDTLNLMWFFYLRAEDLPRLKAEWFQDQGDEIICLLEQTKGNRPQQRTTHYRPDAIANWRRMNKRKPKGNLVFPHIYRSDSNVSVTLKQNLNDLLRYVLEQCDPPIPSQGVTMTNIRHTAFRLTLEEVPELGSQPAIFAFAQNGMTSAEMLQRTYLRFIEEESTAKRARSQIRPGDWSLVRRVGG